MIPQSFLCFSRNLKKPLDREGLDFDNMKSKDMRETH